ncbi:MAG: hypothetical protein PHF21_00375 [Bacilli bacterium]|nr:hypothetical protein [Bacilli bacterium]
MKKVFVLLIGILMLPLCVNAMAVSETFKVGDRVKVLVENDNEGHEFFVIKPSAAGEEYVWMILNENVMDNYGKSITVFDEVIPGEHETLTVWEESLAYSVLHNATETWRSTETRLLNLQDLIDLGLEKEPVSGEYQIMGNRKYLAPIKLTGGYPGMVNPKSAYNYWTQIYNTEAEETSVFAVILNEDYNGDSLTPLASVRSHEITSITDNVEFVIRPVIKIHKMYIDCFVDGTTTTVTSPPTAEVKLPFEVISIVAVAGIAYFLLRKKEIFNKI